MRGGGLCVCINKAWCQDAAVWKHCTGLVELMFLNGRPCYLPRELALTQMQRFCFRTQVIQSLVKCFFLRWHEWRGFSQLFRWHLQWAHRKRPRLLWFSPLDPKPLTSPAIGHDLDLSLSQTGWWLTHKTCATGQTLTFHRIVPVWMNCTMWSVTRPGSAPCRRTYLDT